MIPTWLIILVGLFVLAVLVRTLVVTWMEGQTARDRAAFRRIEEEHQKRVDRDTKTLIDEVKGQMKDKDKDKDKDKKPRDWRDI